MKNIEDILKENKAKEEPYKVPEGYFEDFTARLNAKIDAMEAEKAAQTAEESPAAVTYGHKIWLTLKPIVYVAAAIMVLYGATYVIVQPKVQRAVSEVAESVDSDAVNGAAQEYEDYYRYVLDEDGVEGEDFIEYCSIK